MTTTAGKWFEIDSKKGQVYLVGAATRELAFEYHDKGYIALEANLGFEDGKTISFSQGGNTVTAMDEKNRFSEVDIGKYIYAGDGWHKILSVRDATIIGHGTNLFNVQDSVLVSDGVTVDDDGWITFTADNSAGSNVIYRNYFTAPSDALKAGHEYLIIVEVAEMSVFGGNAVIRPISRSSEANQSQFDGTWSMTANSPVGTYVKKLRTLDDFSGATYMLRTDVLFYAGASGNVKIRLTVADEKPFLTLDNAQGQIESVAVEAGCRAKQAGTGAASPANVRAITGRESVEIAACGKNLLDITKITNDSQPNTIVEINGNSIRIAAEERTYGCGRTHLYLPAGTYVLAAEIEVTKGTSRLGRRVSEDGGETYPGTLTQSTGTGQMTFTIQPGEEWNQFTFFCSYTNAEEGDVTYSNIRLYAGTDATEFMPYEFMGGGTVTPTEPLYGLTGAEDTVEISTDGDVTVTRRTAVLELDGTESWIKVVFNTTWVFQHMNLTPVAKGAPASAVANALCSHYDVKTGGSTSGGEQGISVSHGNYIEICDMNYLEPDDFKAYLAAQAAAGTPVTIVYELATPTTETPVDVAPIEPNTGEVNVFTDADSLNITLYKTENNKYASVTGSFSQTQNDFASMLTQMNEISISGEDVELTKLEIDYVPQVR